MLYTQVRWLLLSFHVDGIVEPHLKLAAVDGLQR
jgi:hypothetical protein